MGRVAAIGEEVRVQGLALAVPWCSPVRTPTPSRAGWVSLPPDVTVVVLTPGAAAPWVPPAGRPSDRGDAPVTPPPPGPAQSRSHRCAPPCWPMPARTRPPRSPARRGSRGPRRRGPGGGRGAAGAGPSRGCGRRGRGAGRRSRPGRPGSPQRGAGCAPRGLDEFRQQSRDDVSDLRRDPGYPALLDALVDRVRACWAPGRPSPSTPAGRRHRRRRRPPGHSPWTASPTTSSTGSARISTVRSP